ncbi:MAG TPA: TonB-dependent receptor, partial [Flavisolibacter sp.]|nr:TonB-dependent receptor [Flavisolibacter sp.]
MRPFLALMLAQLTFFGLKAQQVSGFVKDAQGAPVSSATVSLLKASDSSVIKLAVSKETGFYIFSGIKTGNYRVSVTHVGYNRFVSAPVAVTDGDVTVPDLQLAKSAGDMKGIVVTAQKPIVEVKADKMILNVEGTINATGSDALELLRKSPGVSVDKDENLSVSGKNGVQVYIDGRPTPLTGSDLSAYLKTLQSSQIEAIEIISNPSAKYEAAGNAGIINIRLKKDKSLGTNGSVNAGWNIGTYAK